MSEKLELLEVVDGNDSIIGLEDRKKIHRDGLLHREIHIFFITPKGEIIFQHRAKNKDTFPDKLDATVAGHVEPNASYEETAVKETKEETGLDIKPKSLILLEKMNLREVDETTGLINNTIRVQYAYLYKGSVGDLIVEKGKAIGFEPWKIESLFTLSNEDKSKFKPIVISDKFLSLFRKAKSSV
ncbi:MAG: NUDIX domain-containing protein [Minisyncoccia bacterium]